MTPPRYWHPNDPDKPENLCEACGADEWQTHKPSCPVWAGVSYDEMDPEDR